MPVGIRGDLIRSNKFLALDTRDRWCFVVLGLELTAIEQGSHTFEMKTVLQIVGMEREQFEQSIIRIAKTGLLKREKGGIVLVDGKRFFSYYGNEQQGQNKRRNTAPTKGAERRVFEYWQSIHNLPNAKPTRKRMDKVKSRLKEGYTEDDLQKAIVGCSLSSFHMGENERSTKYNDLELICRSGERVESFIQIAEDSVVRRQKEAKILPGKSSTKRQNLLTRHRTRTNELQEIDLDEQ